MPYIPPQPLSTKKVSAAYVAAQNKAALSSEWREQELAANSASEGVTPAVATAADKAYTNAYNSVKGNSWRDKELAANAAAEKVLDAAAAAAAKKKKITTPPPPAAPALAQPNKTPDKIKFNLPPHAWSLPVKADALSTTPLTDDGYRLSRMWAFQAPNPTQTAADAKTQVKNGSTAPDYTAAQLAGTVAGQSNISVDNNWGFQFLWNPTTITTALSRNMSVTPSSTDQYAGLAGMFSAMEQISFSIVINRVNDFACARSLGIPAYNTNSDSTQSVTIDQGSLNTLITKGYYSGGYPSNPDNPEKVIDQLSALMRLGTMADVEYIFKMLNGSGSGSGTTQQNWTNALGKHTADVAFLNPTAVAIQFGPTINNLSYVGYIDSMQIVHSVFTQDMLPLHTEIQMSFLGFSMLTISAGAI